MATTTKYPTKINQSSGSTIVQFHNLNNIKNNNTKAYAMTGLIAMKPFLKRTPATVNTTDYKLKIPSNALVKKVTVKYYHTVRGVKNGNISNDKLIVPNIPAPTISLLGTKLGSKKGQAPHYTGKAQTVTWTGKWNANSFNATGFGVKIAYGANNSFEGYLRLHYLAVTVEYTTPAYSLQANTGNTTNVYNHDEYDLKVNVSDKNLTGKGAPSVLIQVPYGFSFKRCSGTITKVQNLLYRWTPKKLSKNSDATEVFFDVDVSFPSGRASKTFTFTVSIEGTNIARTVNTLIYKEKPKDGTDDEPEGEPVITDDDITPLSDYKFVEIDEEIQIDIEQKTENALTLFAFPIDETGTPIYHSENTSMEINEIGGAGGWELLTEYNDYDDYIGFKPVSLWDYIDIIRCREYGTYCLRGYIESEIAPYRYFKGGYDEATPILEVKFMCRPSESSLTTPNFAKITLTEEELNRLGDGYAYTAQSNMKLYGYSEYYNDSTTNSLTYVSSATPLTLKGDGGPAPRPDQFTYEFDFKTTSTDARVFIANESLEGKTPQTFPRNSISMGTIDGKLAAHMAGDTGVEVFEGDTATLDTYYNMKIEYDGTELSCYVDDTLLGTFSNCKWIKTISDIYFSLFIMETGTVTCKDRLMWYGEGKTYVRDWYKNFRMGVFNNPIRANQHTYYQYDNEDTEFDAYMFIPGKYDINDATLKIDVDAPVTLTINETEYDITTTETIDMFETYNIPVTFTQAGTDNVVITITLYDSEDTEQYNAEYHINFQAAETKPIQEITEDSTDYDNLTDEQIFQYADYWTENTAGLNKYNSVECQFTYEKDYPLYIIYTGDYPEGEQSTSIITFNEPCIIESEDYHERRENGNYPAPIDNLILTEGSGQIILTPDHTSESIIFYDWPLDENYGTNEEMAIRGIEVSGNIEQSDELVLYCRLKSPTGASRERSIIIDDYETVLDAENRFHLGGNGDLWGFSTLDILNLEQWELEMRLANTLEDVDTSISFNDVQIIFYVSEVDKQNVTCKIEGEDIGYYGVFLTELKIPEGLETDTEYLKVDGTDTNDAYRQNIKEKVIELEFDIGEGCSLEASTLSLRDFARLLVNDRDEYNRPIPKTIEFSHYPDVYWEYIMEEPFENTIDINTYQCKVKLTIPAGTSYDKEVTTTASTGYVNGLASINPVIIVKPIEDTITIRESVSGQEFHMGYTEWNDRIIEIDCESRIVWLKQNEDDEEPININKYVDFNSNWFTLKGEYAFEGIGCVVRTVDYQERWS